ncbi:ankyrin-like protein [Vaccinia virus]|uniref:Ankyrin-like protein n=1 Tax=Vaccinia virus TaxID=10245 RepID=A0A0M4RHK7_VACCV|nr:ankyrin-like protein [Vaccinia virus]ALF05216.1 ankyrin-like protein [Vaccinia virus]ALF05233.1 ankyrin-like protein [Vaccinia virus]ALF05462.1 ankyrin-like protein [Vaccinia virus]
MYGLILSRFNNCGYHCYETILIDVFDILSKYTAFQNCNNNVASYIGYDINLPTKDGIRLGV